MYNYCLWPKWPEGQRNDANPIIKYKLHMHAGEIACSEVNWWPGPYIIPWNTIFLSLSFLVTYPPSGRQNVETTDQDSGVLETLSRLLFSCLCFVFALDPSISWIVIVLPGKVNIIWIMIKKCLCWSDVFLQEAKPLVGICWAYFMLYWCHNKHI